jgi:hypothetical protein
VAVGSGKHVVDLVYAPLTFYVGLACSIIYFIVWILAGLLSLRGRAVHKAPAKGDIG